MPDPTPPQPMMPPPLDPKIVVEIIRLTYLQWIMVLVGIGWIAVHKNYDINPVLIPLLAGVLSAEVLWIGQVINWGVGSSIGSIMKNMAIRMMGQTPPPTVTVTPPPDGTTVTTVATDNKTTTP